MPARAEQFRFIPAQYAYKDATGEFVKATPISLASHETPAVTNSVTNLEGPQLALAMFAHLRRGRHAKSFLSPQDSELVKLLSSNIAKKYAEMGLLEGRLPTTGNTLPTTTEGEIALTSATVDLSDPRRRFPPERPDYDPADPRNKYRLEQPDDDRDNPKRKYRPDIIGDDPTDPRGRYRSELPEGYNPDKKPV